MTVELEQQLASVPLLAGLEPKFRPAQRLQIRPVEVRLLHASDGLLHQRGHLLQFVHGGRVRHAEGEDDPALFHPLVVADPAADQVGVGDDQQLVIQSTDLG